MRLFFNGVEVPVMSPDGLNVLRVEAELGGEFAAPLRVEFHGGPVTIYGNWNQWKSILLDFSDVTFPADGETAGLTLLYAGEYPMMTVMPSNDPDPGSWRDRPPMA